MINIFKEKMKSVTWKFLAGGYLAITFAAAFNGCKPRYLYPVEPHLEFVSLTQTHASQLGDELLLKLRFTDGDGDIGELKPSSGSEENLKVFLHLKDNSVWKVMDTLPGSFGACLESLISTGEESLSGYIEQKLYIQGLRDLQLRPDTVRFECWLIDRKKHESNRVLTSEYIIEKR
jgi:hypothetical protein